MNQMIFKAALFLELSIMLVHCSESKDSAESPSVNPTSSLSFSDISQIIKNSCALSGCHGLSGAKSVVFENNEANFKSAKAAIKDRLSRSKTDKLFMPQPPGSLNDSDKSKILSYLN